MNTKTLIFLKIVAICCLTSTSMADPDELLNQRVFQDTSVPPMPPNPYEVFYSEEDFQPPGHGKVSRAGIKEMKQFNKVMGTRFEQVPNDVTGKKSKWYPRIQEAKKAFEQALQTGRQEDLFKIIPTLAAFQSRDWKSEPFDAEGSVGLWMEVCGTSLIKAAAAYIAEHNGEVNPDLLANFVKLFSVRGFFIAPEWEDEPTPIDSGGLMIVDATKVVAQLKNGSREQAEKFLGGRMTPEHFFKRYAVNGKVNPLFGDGLPVLKAKYAANKAAIDAKFNELKTWIEQQTPSQQE